MWKNEFKRLFFSKKTLAIIAILLALGFMSFYFSYNDRLGFIQTQARNPDDIDPIKMASLINNYNGIQFVLDFFLTSDYFQMSTVIFFLFIGIFLSSDLHDMIDTGQENFILSRTSYAKHIKALFIAQSCYLVSILFIADVIIFVVGLIVGGHGSGISSVGIYEFNIITALLVVIIQYVLNTIFYVLINGICLFSNMLIKSKIVLQCLPFVLFLVAPVVISSTLGNMVNLIGLITYYFIPFVQFGFMYWILQARFEIFSIMEAITPVVFYLLLFFVVAKKNRDIFSKDCL